MCLVQCARGDRPPSANCVIFEINKFLIGLELVRERQVRPDTRVLTVEDDTNCSLSSIEDDFLTASEHWEEESEEERRHGEAPGHGRGTGHPGTPAGAFGGGPGASVPLPHRHRRVLAGCARRAGREHDDGAAGALRRPRRPQARHRAAEETCVF